MSVPSSYGGKVGRCTKCKGMTTVPKAGEPGAELSASDERPLTNTLVATSVGVPTGDAAVDALEQERLKLELERAALEMERRELARAREAQARPVEPEGERDNRPRRTCDGCWNKILIEANVCRFCGKKQENAGLTAEQIQSRFWRERIEWLAELVLIRIPLAAMGAVVVVILGMVAFNSLGPSIVLGLVALVLALKLAGAKV